MTRKKAVYLWSFRLTLDNLRETQLCPLLVREMKKSWLFDIGQKKNVFWEDCQAPGAREAAFSFQTSRVDQ